MIDFWFFRFVSCSLSGGCDGCSICVFLDTLVEANVPASTLDVCVCLALFVILMMPE